MSRVIGSGSKPATGASPGSSGGDSLGRSRIDHKHKMWDNWEELPIASGWAADYSTEWRGGLWLAGSANYIEINGYIKADDPLTPASNPLVSPGGIPEIYRPEKDILHCTIFIVHGFFSLPALVPIKIGADGSLTYLDFITLGSGSIELIFGLFNNFYYRTDV